MTEEQEKRYIERRQLEGGGDGRLYADLKDGTIVEARRVFYEEKTVDGLRRVVIWDRQAYRYCGHDGTDFVTVDIDDINRVVAHARAPFPKRTDDNTDAIAHAAKHRLIAQDPKYAGCALRQILPAIPIDDPELDAVVPRDGSPVKVCDTVTRTKMREERFYRLMVPPLMIPDNMLDRSIDIDRPVSEEKRDGHSESA